MSYKVRSEYYGIMHNVGACEVCNATFDAIEISETRRRAKAHTRETGHPTYVEAGSTTRYALEEVTKP